MVETGQEIRGEPPADQAGLRGDATKTHRAPGRLKAPMASATADAPDRFVVGFFLSPLQISFRSTDCEVYPAVRSSFHISFLRRQASESFFLSPTISKIVVLKKF